MECLCFIRDIYRSIKEFEIHFQQEHNLCLNEGMLLCALNEKVRSSGEIADLLGLTTSNTSKVIKSIEKKNYIERRLGKEDKRQMYFGLTESGKKKLSEIKNNESQISKALQNILTLVKQ